MHFSNAPGDKRRKTAHAFLHSTICHAIMKSSLSLWAAGHTHTHAHKASVCCSASRSERPKTRKQQPQETPKRAALLCNVVQLFLGLLCSTKTYIIHLFAALLSSYYRMQLPGNCTFLLCSCARSVQVVGSPYICFAFGGRC